MAETIEQLKAENEKLKAERASRLPRLKQAMANFGSSVQRELAGLRATAVQQKEASETFIKQVDEITVGIEHTLTAANATVEGDK